MSETLSQLPTGSSSTLSDIVPLTQGSSGPGTGTTRKLTAGQILAAGGYLYAADPAYGVKSDGVTDDTGSWNSVLSAAASKGQTVIAPPGTTVISSITIPTTVRIVGYSTESYAISSGPNPTTGTVFKTNSSTAPAIKMNAGSQLKSVQIIGNPGQPCIQAQGQMVLVIDVDAFGGSIGFDGQLNTISELTRCRFHENGVGVASIVQSKVEICHINANTGHGISLTTGSNSNNIVGCRIERNTGNNINIAGFTGNLVRHNTICGNTFDAPGGNHIALSFAGYTTITGNDMARASRSQNGSGVAADASLYLANSKAISIASNTTSVGQNDGASGYLGPFYAIFDGGSNTNCMFSANILTYNNNGNSSGSGPINVTTTFNNLATFNFTFWASTDAS